MNNSFTLDKKQTLPVKQKDNKMGVGSINVQFNKKGELVIPEMSPIDNNHMVCVSDKGTPLVPMKKQLQKTIDSLPTAPNNLWKAACSGDEVTVKSWEKKWNDSLDKNELLFDFNKMSCFRFYKREEYKPVIIAGAGPSIKNNAKYLKKTYMPKTDMATGKIVDGFGGGRESITIVSCLHNFAFFEDNNIMKDNDFYINLDSGDITIPELSEGGKKNPEWYWEKTAERTLITTVLSNPVLLKKWKGKIYFFKTGTSVVKDYNKRVEPSKVPTFSVGGNVLGAALYFAKAILAAGPVIFLGADFCFSYDHKFHGWDSQYDNLFAGVVPTVDIYGNRVFTWPSYYNFKCFFEYIALGGIGGNPQLFINATEGGIFGAYPEGNIRHIKQTTLKEILHVFNMHNRLPELMNNGQKDEIVLY